MTGCSDVTLKKATFYFLLRDGSNNGKAQFIFNGKTYPESGSDLLKSNPKDSKLSSDEIKGRPSVSGELDIGMDNQDDSKFLYWNEFGFNELDGDFEVHCLKPLAINLNGMNITTFKNKINYAMFKVVKNSGSGDPDTWMIGGLVIKLESTAGKYWSLQPFTSSFDFITNNSTHDQTKTYNYRQNPYAWNTSQTHMFKEYGIFGTTYRGTDVDFTINNSIIYCVFNIHMFISQQGSENKVYSYGKVDAWFPATGRRGADIDDGHVRVYDTGRVMEKNQVLRFYKIKKAMDVMFPNTGCSKMMTTSGEFIEVSDVQVHSASGKNYSFSGTTLDDCKGSVSLNTAFVHPHKSNFEKAVDAFSGGDHFGDWDISTDNCLKVNSTIFRDGDPCPHARIKKWTSETGPNWETRGMDCYYSITGQSEMIDLSTKLRTAGKTDVLRSIQATYCVGKDEGHRIDTDDAPAINRFCGVITDTDTAQVDGVTIDPIQISNDGTNYTIEWPTDADRNWLNTQPNCNRIANAMTGSDSCTSSTTFPMNNKYYSQFGKFTGMCVKSEESAASCLSDSVTYVMKDPIPSGKTATLETPDNYVAPSFIPGENDPCTPSSGVDSNAQYNYNSEGDCVFTQCKDGYEKLDGATLCTLKDDEGSETGSETDSETGSDAEEEWVEGEVCTPDSPVENSNTYVYDSTGDCVLYSCNDDYELNEDGACEKKKGFWGSTEGIIVIVLLVLLGIAAIIAIASGGKNPNPVVVMQRNPVSLSE